MGSLLSIEPTGDVRLAKHALKALSRDLFGSFMAITGETKRLVCTRLAKAAGHLNAVQRMVDEEVYCIDVLNQLKAVQSALDRAAQLMLKQHLNTCVVEAVKADDSARVMEELWQLLRKGSANEADEISLSAESCCGQGENGD